MSDSRKRTTRRLREKLNTLKWSMINSPRFCERDISNTIIRLISAKYSEGWRKVQTGITMEKQSEECPFYLNTIVSFQACK